MQTSSAGSVDQLLERERTRAEHPPNAVLMLVDIKVMRGPAACACVFVNGGGGPYLAGSGARLRAAMAMYSSCALLALLGARRWGA